MKVGRNDRCPCGSGLKVKRCCGVDGVRRSQEAVAELFDLAFHFPRYRPASREFDTWALTAPSDPTREALGEGLAQLDARERERIVGGFRGEYPQVWSGVVEDLGDEDLAVEMVLAGAVEAGVSERLQPLDEQALKLLEHDADARADPVEALALTIEARDLWNVIESGLALEAVDAADEELGYRVYAAADRLATGWHDERLAVLLDRVRERLPNPTYPLASAALTQACDRVTADRRLACRLRAELLLDSLPGVVEALLAAA